jgi:hypothetical protein
MARARTAVAVALLPMSIVVLAGCGSDKLSAGQTAQKLGGFLSPSYRVRCDGASGSFWDYSCTVTPPPGAKNQPYTLKVRVGPHEILDRVVCGARSGTQLNC